MDTGITDLEIVNSPLSEGLGVNCFITQGTRVATASHSASARVHAILQAQSMNLVCGTAHAIRELCGIRHKSAGDRITVILYRPTVVEDDVLVPSVFETQVDHGVRGLHDLGLVHVAEVCVLVLVSVAYANRSILRPTHEFQPRAGSLPTPSGSSRPSTTGNAASKKAPVRDMVAEAKEKTRICFYTRRQDVHSQAAAMAVTPLYVLKARLNGLHTVLPVYRWHRLHLDTTTIVFSEGAIIQCFGMLPRAWY